MTNAPPDPAPLRLLLTQTRRLLAFHLSFGLSSYPAAPKLRQFMAARVPAPAAVCSPPPSEQKKQVLSAAQQIESVLSLPEIARQLADCRRCSSAASTPMPGIGCMSPKLMVVSSRSFQEIPSHGIILGQNQAEDELFWRMMAAIGLNRETVYVTNLAKCVQCDMRSAEHNCLFWLKQELRAIQPRLICAMGEPAARLLTGGKDTPLLRLRGKLYTCCLPTASQAQVAATYHPNFLLQQPDMKQAAWLDLQIIQRRLQPWGS